MDPSGSDSIEISPGSDQEALNDDSELSTRSNNTEADHHEAKATSKKAAEMDIDDVLSRKEQKRMKKAKRVQHLTCLPIEFKLSECMNQHHYAEIDYKKAYLDKIVIILLSQPIA